VRLHGIAACCLLLVGLLPLALAAPTGAKSTAGGTSASLAPERVREGTRLDQVTGEFQMTGDRILFVSDGYPSLRVLENLSLERVAQTLTERGAGRQWTVSGAITEYRGVNYLLLTRASLKTKHAE
jgi:hypothetical protein